MKLIKVETSGQTVRWINLDLVSRVTLADEPNGHRLMGLVFADGHRASQLKLDSEAPLDQGAIEQLCTELDQATQALGVRKQICLQSS